MAVRRGDRGDGGSGAAVVIFLFAAFLQWSSTTLADRSPQVIQSGSWQSCPEDGDYTELARDFLLHDRPWFAFHMGPRDEFALFSNEGASEHIAHDDKRNLLGPAYHYSDMVTKTGRHWAFANLGIKVSIAQLPGSHEDCYSFLVRLEKDAPPTWAHKE